MKMYRLLVAAVVFAALVLVGGHVQAQVKVGTVDVQRVRDENSDFKKALNEINDMVKEFEQRRDRQADELQKLSEDLQDAQQRGLQGSAQSLQNELQSKSGDFQQFMQETFGDSGIIENKSAELLTPLYTKLADAAKVVAKDKGLDLILDLEQVNPLFSSDALDVTDDILKEFEKL